MRSDNVCHLGIGRTYQICQPFGAMTVRHNVMVGAFSRYKKRSEAAEKANEVLEKWAVLPCGCPGQRADTS